MLSKDQANAAAEALIFQAKASRVEKIRPVAWLYRCRELSSLEPRQRDKVVQQATKDVSQKPLFVLMVMAWFGILLLFWLYGLSDSNRNSYTSLFITGCWIIPLCCRAILIRRKVRKAARIIAEHEAIRLSREEQIRFVPALLNPPEPPDRLRQAAQQYRGLTGV